MLDILKSFFVKLGQIIRGSIKSQRKKDTDENLQKRVDELAILNKLSIALSSGQDLYHLLRLLLEEVKKIFVIDDFYIGIYDPETEMISFPIFYDRGKFLDINSRNLREEPGLTGAVIFSEKTLYIPDQTDPEVVQRYKPFSARQQQSRSYVGIPLMLNNTVIGILSVQSEQPGVYTPQQIQLLETIAAQSATAIDKARLLHDLQSELDERKKLIAELESKNAETETLRESASIITATLKMSEAVDLILEQLERVVPYNSASVQLINDNKLEVVRARGLNHDVENTIWKFEINENEPAYPILHGNIQYILYDDVQVAIPAFNDIPHNKVHAWLAVPLKIKDKMLGIITLDGYSVGQFTERHAQLAVAYANQVAVALENARLFDEAQRELAERERSEQELRESESKLRAIIENVPFEMWLSDKERRYILQSGESLRLVGNIIGKTIEDLGMSPEITAQWKGDYERVMEGETVYKEGKRKVGGELRDFIYYLAPIRVGEEIFGFVGISLDITERKRAEILLQRRAEEFETLYQTAQAFSQKTDLSSLLVEIAECARLLLKADNGFLWLYDSQNDDLEHRVSTKIPIQGERLRLGEGMAGKIAQTRQPMIIENYHTWNGRTKYFESWNIAAMLGVPMLYAGTLVGVLGVENFAPNMDKFDKADAQLLSLFAAQAAAAVSNTNYVDQIRQNAIELEKRVEERTTQLHDANQNLHQEKIRLEQYSRQREIMATMTDLLQASLTTKEASHIVSTHLKLLFPNRDGALYLLASPNTFEPVAVWGEKKSLDVIYATNECWGLRRGKPYRFGVGLPNPPCAHVGKDIPHYALCMPLSAQGESLGNLHISTQNNQDIEIIDDEDQKFIETIADSIALAIANLRLREKLHFESIRDGLTGLFNRRYLDETLPREIHRAERSKLPISVLMFDIDHFKKFNDTFGHDAGDVVLKSMAGLMLSVIRESDIACKYGGEEFTIILPDTPIEIATHRAESLRKEVSTMELHHNGQNLGKVTISIGVATYPQHGTTRDTLIKSADEAAYQAKEGGRDQVVVSK